MTDTQIWSPADMRSKLSKWKETKKTKANGSGEVGYQRRPLASSHQKKNASHFVEGANDENTPSNSHTNSNSKTNQFGFRKKTPKSFEKRKLDSRSPLTPAQKRGRTPMSSINPKETSVADIAAKCLPSESETKALLTKKVCVGLRKHELSKKLTRLQGLLKQTRLSYNDYLSGVRVLVERCELREAALAMSADEHIEKNRELQSLREDLEHTISNLKDEQKTHVRNITEMIESKKTLSEENSRLISQHTNLTNDLKSAADINEKANADIAQLRSDLQQKKEAYEELKAEFDSAKDEMAMAVSEAKAEQESKQMAVEATTKAQLSEIRAQLMQENTKAQVLEAQRASLEEQLKKLDAHNAAVTKAKDELQAKTNELSISQVRQTAQIEGLQANVEQLKTSLAEKEEAFQKSMDNFDKIINQNETRAARSDSEKDSLADKLSLLAATHSQLEASSRELQNKIVQLEQQLADATANGEQASTELKASMEQLTKQEEALSKLEETHNTVVRDFDQAQSKFNEARLAWEDQHSMLSSQVEEAQEKIGVLQADLKTAEHKVITAEAQKQSKQEELEKQEAKVKEYEKSMSADVREIMARMSEMLETRDKMSKQLTSQDHLAHDYACARREVEKLRQLLLESETARRKLHNRVQELRGNIRVFVRVRPFLPGDGDEYEKKVPSLKCLADGQGVQVGDKKEHQFSFDRVFKRNATQSHVFEEVSELVQSALDGYNVCIFSYGQTGSGKTYTMQGFPENPEQRGLIPRSMEQILETSRRMQEQGWTFDFQASFVEIYNEQVRDLLRTSDAGVSCDIKRNAQGKTYAQGVEKMPMRNMDDVGQIMSVAASKRAVGCTAMNSVSSRSHSVFTIFITGTCEQHGKKIIGALNLCDLAGSERLARSQATGAALKETQAINKSLSALTNVFMALKAKASHIPYRNSKLTYLLENCFSKDGKTMMLVNVSPTLLSQQETTCSMRFAQQVNQCELGKATAQVQEIKAPAKSRSGTPAKSKSGGGSSRNGGNKTGGKSKRSRK